MLLIIITRVAITLTFLMLAAGGPYAIWQLRRFIRRSVTAQAALEARVTALERLKAGEQ